MGPQYGTCCHPSDIQNFEVALTYFKICVPVPKGMFIVHTAALLINFKAELQKWLCPWRFMVIISRKLKNAPFNTQFWKSKYHYIFIENLFFTEFFLTQHLGNLEHSELMTRQTCMNYSICQCGQPSILDITRKTISVVIRRQELFLNLTAYIYWWKQNKHRKAVKYDKSQDHWHPKSGYSLCQLWFSSAATWLWFSTVVTGWLLSTCTECCINITQQYNLVFGTTKMGN